MGATSYSCSGQWLNAAAGDRHAGDLSGLRTCSFDTTQIVQLDFMFPMLYPTPGNWLHHL